MNTTAAETRTVANEMQELSYAHCADHYVRHPYGFIFTSGVETLIENCKAYWLLDLIGSYKFHKRSVGQPFQVWKLERTKGDSFKVTMEDGNGNIQITQRIPYSDFPYDVANLWLIDGILILPSEY